MMDFGIRKAGKQEKIFDPGNFPAFLLSLFPYLPARCAAMKPESDRPVPAGTASLRLASPIRRQPTAPPRPDGASAATQPLSSCSKKSGHPKLDISCHVFPEFFPIRETRLSKRTPQPAQNEDQNRPPPSLLPELTESLSSRSEPTLCSQENKIQQNMPNNQLTGMTGVYLVAAELSRRGFIASPTSRSAQGADILVTDIDCKKSFAVQVKTNAATFGFWLLSSKVETFQSKTLVYAFVNLRKDRTDFYLVPSIYVAKNFNVSKPSKTRKSIWHAIKLDQVAQYKDKWEIFNK